MPPNGVTPRICYNSNMETSLELLGKKPKSKKPDKESEPSLPPSPPSSPEKGEIMADLKQLEESIKKAEEWRDKLKSALESNDKDNIETTSVSLKEALFQAKSLRRKIEGGKEVPIISAIYTHADETGKEIKETINLDFEAKLAYSLDFYKKHSLPIPDDFSDLMRDIWLRNTEAMEKSISEKGFDNILLIPPDLSLPDLHQRMSKDYNETWQSDNFKSGGSFAGVKEKTKEPRLVLIHQKNAQHIKDHPELKSTLNQTAESLITQGESLTLTDYLILQRQFFETTGEHLDTKAPDGLYYWTWLPGSKSGSRVVSASWVPGVGQLFVYANDPGDSRPLLGCRLSRSFSLEK